MTAPNAVHTPDALITAIVDSPLRISIGIAVSSMRCYEGIVFGRVRLVFIT